MIGRIRSAGFSAGLLPILLNELKGGDAGRADLKAAAGEAVVQRRAVCLAEGLHGACLATSARTQVLPCAAPTSATLRIYIRTPVLSSQQPKRLNKTSPGNFSWQVLSAVADGVAS